MTGPRGVPSAHLDASTIAAFVDRTLDPAARAAAEAHLAGCADCREVWVETSELANEEAGAQTPRPTPRAAPRWRMQSGRWLVLPIAAAVVLAIALWQLQIGWSNDRSLRALVDAVGTSRFAVARSSVAFKYGPAPSVQRGTTTGYRASAAVEEAAARIHERSAAEPSASNMKAAAIAHLTTGDPSAAIAMLERARDADPAIAIDTDLSAALLERWRLTGSAEDAVRGLHHAETALAAQPEDVAALFNRALALEAVGLRSRAATAWEEYLSSERSPAWRAEAQARLQALRATSNVEPPHSPEATLPSGNSRRDRCAAAFAASKARWTQLWEDAQYASAAVETRKGREALICAGLPTLESDMQIGLVESANGRIIAAMPILQRTLSQAARARAWEIASRSAIALGVMAFKQGDVEGGTKYLKVGVTTANASNLAPLRAAAHSMLADAYLEQAATEEMWEHQFAAISALDGVASLRTAYTVLSGAAVAARTEEMSGAALRFADELLRSTGTWANPGGQLFARLERARAAAALGRTEEALEDLVQAESLLPMLEEPLRSDFRAEILAAAGRVKTPGNPKAAIAALTESLTLFDAQHNVIRRAGLLLDRGRAHSTAGDIDGARSDWREAARLVERERGSISDRQLRISRFSHVWDLYDELLKLETDPVLSLSLLERVRGREIAQPSSPPGNSRDLFDWLPSDSIVVVYVTMSDALSVWTVSADHVQMRRHPIGAARLGRLVDDHNQRIQHERPDLGVYLGGVLLPDEVQRNPRRRTLFVADGPLHRLAFGTLRSHDGRQLIEWTEPTMAPSLTMAKRSAAGCSVRVSQRVVLAGYGGASSGLPPLPYVETELGALSRIYPNATVLSGAEASVAAVLREASSASLVHIAGHAVADISSPARSRILLAPSLSAPGLLKAADIALLRLESRPLVVLPACDTAAGRVFRGEGPVSLSTSFLLAGASGVIGALRPIDDADAARLMTHFHQALASGQHPASALAAAQRWAKARRLPTRSWSAFIHYGSIATDTQPCPLSQLSSRTSD